MFLFSVQMKYLFPKNRGHSVLQGLRRLFSRKSFSSNFECIWIILSVLIECMIPSIIFLYQVTKFNSFGLYLGTDCVYNDII